MNMATLQHTSYAPAGTQVFFLPQLMSETLGLIEKAHDYFEGEGRFEMETLTQDAQMFYASEMSRVTMRLSFVMAWCLGQRAVVEGEISTEEAVDHFRLEGNDICLQETEHFLPLMPSRMQELMAKSEKLYRRTQRLDMDMARGHLL